MHQQTSALVHEIYKQVDQPPTHLPITFSCCMQRVGRPWGGGPWGEGLGVGALGWGPWGGGLGVGALGWGPWGGGLGTRVQPNDIHSGPLKHLGQ